MRCRSFRVRLKMSKNYVFYYLISDRSIGKELWIHPFQNYHKLYQYWEWILKSSKFNKLSNSTSGFCSAECPILLYLNNIL